MSYPYPLCSGVGDPYPLCSGVGEMAEEGEEEEEEEEEEGEGLMVLNEMGRWKYAGQKRNN